MERPVGRPLADQVRVAPDRGSVARSVQAVMADPTRRTGCRGSSTVTVLVIVQVKLALPMAPEPSVAVTVTE